MRLLPTVPSYIGQHFANHALLQTINSIVAVGNYFHVFIGSNVFIHSLSENVFGKSMKISS